MLSLFLLLFSCSKKDDNNDNPGNGGGNVSPNLQLVADNFISPLSVTEAPDGTGRLFVLDQTGKIWIIKNGTRMDVPFIDISTKLVTLQQQYDERGLLGLAFHPDYKSNGKFYLFYTAPPRAGGPEPGATWSSLTRISEFKVSGSNADVADMNSERILIEADHPQLNHNGGTIAFGNDGYLYISIGDGGGSNDVGPGHVTDWYAVNKGGNAQNIFANLMGKILRIDVNSGSPYGIPADNPFVGTTARPEIYAYGFRNPYRFSFDMGGTHQLYVGDAGQKLYEEINLVTKGSNYGWNVKEGNICFDADSNTLTRPDCPSVDSLGKELTLPWLQLVNTANPSGGGVATVIVGGYVYRGTALPSYIGRYIFGIFSKSPTAPDAKLYIAAAGGGTYEEIQLKDFPTNLGQYVKGFGQDLSGEVYVTTCGVQGVSGHQRKSI